MTLRAILADDEELSLDMLRVLLEETASGVEVIATCGTGEETLARAEELKPDLIFLDVNMPALNGMEVAAALRRSDEPRPMVVFTTAHAEFAAEAFDV